MISNGLGDRGSIPDRQGFISLSPRPIRRCGPSGGEAAHSSSFAFEVKNVLCIHPFTHTSAWHRTDIFVFTCLPYIQRMNFVNKTLLVALIFSFGSR
jgi:hypothetical protein